MKEGDYIKATSIAHVRAIQSLLRDLYPDGRYVATDELRYVARCVDVWAARLEQAISPETRRENKEPWRLEWPSTVQR